MAEAPIRLMIVDDHPVVRDGLHGMFTGDPRFEVVGQVRTPAVEPLSRRELEVLQLIARGATNREAARRLFISEASVKAHLLHVYAKLGVNDRAAAVAAAYERGLLTPGGDGGD